MSRICFPLRAIIIFICFVIIFAPDGVSVAQMVVEQLRITEVDISGFPEVKIRLIIRDANGNPIPITNLRNLTITEKVFDKEEIIVSDESHQFEITSTPVGVEVWFVIDISGDLMRTGASRSYLLDEIKTVLSSFVNGMTEYDRAGIMIVAGNQVETLQDLTSEKTALNAVISTIPQSGEIISFGRYGLEQAITNLMVSENHGILTQSVVLVTPQLFHGNEGLFEITETAKKAHITINTVLTRDSEYFGAVEPLKYLATNTKGVYIYYKNQAVMETLDSWFQKQRQQLQVKYRSEFANQTERLIRVYFRDIKNSPMDERSYQVKLAPPKLQIVSLAYMQEIQIDQGVLDENQTGKSIVEAVEVQLDWEDNYPREIIQANLFVNGEDSNLTFSKSQDNLLFAWDLVPYLKPGTQLLTLKVKITDELGFEGVSEDLPIKLVLSTPELVLSTQQPVITPTEQVISEIPIETVAETTSVMPCQDLQGLKNAVCKANLFYQDFSSTTPGRISLGLVGFTAFAFLMSMYFRLKAKPRRVEIKVEKTQQGKPKPGFSETMTQLDIATRQEASAYLEVLQGDAEFIGKPIPLYANSRIVLGRSLKEADVVFQASQERSIVSRRHCQVFEDKGVFKIKDLGSSHGTFIDGYKLGANEEKVLLNGDRIELGLIAKGGLLFIFRQSKRDEETQSDTSYDAKPTYFGNIE